MSDIINESNKLLAEGSKRWLKEWIDKNGEPPSMWLERVESVPIPKNLFDIGDKVMVVKYGSYMYEVIEGGKWVVKDMATGVVGQIGIVSKVSECQGKWEYALEGIEGKHAWYNEEQLEMVNRNPNNDL